MLLAVLRFASIASVIILLLNLIQFIFHIRRKTPWLLRATQTY